MSNTFHGARTIIVVDDAGRVREVANPVKVNQASAKMRHRTARRNTTRAAQKRRALSDWR